MVIGYILWGPDNGSEMFSDMEELVEPQMCGSCGFRTDYRQTNNLFKVKRKTYDLSHTYDGIVITSLRFKEFCKRHDYNNLVFKELEKSFGFSQMIIEDSYIPFRAGLLENYCNECGQYMSVIDPHAAVDEMKESLQDGFYQSNLMFGGRSTRPFLTNPLTPLVVIAPSTKEKLEKEKFKHLNF